MSKYSEFLNIFNESNMKIKTLKEHIPESSTEKKRRNWRIENLFLAKRFRNNYIRKNSRASLKRVV